MDKLIELHAGQNCGINDYGIKDLKNNTKITKCVK
jgi:hypothetical protein